MRRILLPAALLIVLLAASGCSSPSTGTTGTASPTTAAGSHPANATVEFSCTAMAGGVVGGVGGPNGPTVSGCTLTKLKQSSEYVREDIPAGCGVTLFNNDGDNLSDGSPSVGQTYDAGTSFSLGCSASNPSGKGTISVRPV